MQRGGESKRERGRETEEWGLLGGREKREWSRSVCNCDRLWDGKLTKPLVIIQIHHAVPGVGGG